MSLANLRMEVKVADKDHTLQQLRSQVTELFEEAETIKDKLKSVSELEAQLQSLIETEEDSEADTDADRDSASTSGSIPAAESGNRLAAYTAAAAVNTRAAAAGGVHSSSAVTSLPL